MKQLIALALGASLAALSATAADAASEKFTVIFGGKAVGHLNVDTTGTHSVVDFDYKNNGRGPTMKEAIDVDAAGLPIKWAISGATTFGSKVSESFAKSGKKANWVDSTGPGKATVTAPSLYVAQNGSPWSLGLYARALLKDADTAMPALPGGTLKLTKGEALTVAGQPGPVAVTAYALGGIETQPETVLLDGAEVALRQALEQFILYTGLRPTDAQIAAAADFARG
jgi:hypothetical protein